MKYFIFLFCIALVYSCRLDHNTRANTDESRYDTIITIDSLNILKPVNPTILTEDVARQTLIEYFNKKGYFSQEKISLDSLLTVMSNENNLAKCFDFDTLYTVHLNKDNILDGIVTYWKIPCGASGTCWLPHKAVITSSGDKYAIIKTDFISDRHIIDSIRERDNYTIIYGNIYDCGNHQIIKSYKAAIKK